jgi:hypothetical protein
MMSVGCSSPKPLDLSQQLAVQVEIRAAGSLSLAAQKMHLLMELLDSNYQIPRVIGHRPLTCPRLESRREVRG